MSAPPKTHDASLTVKNRTATLTFHRDDIRNALTGSQLTDDIIATVNWVNHCQDINVLILTGEGKAFSSGGNIKDMKDRAGLFAGNVPEVEKGYRAGIQRIPLAIYGCEVPVIAAVNGPAMGAGCDLATMCDIRIGSTHAAFGETFLNLGIIPGDGGAYFLQRVIGYQAAAELTFTGRIVKAEEAKTLGLLLKVVEPDALMDVTSVLANDIASKPPQALRYTKRLMRKGQNMQLPDFLDLCAVYQGICHNTDDHVEAVDAFLKKRRSKFHGS